jgi:WD40 repeat protein
MTRSQSPKGLVRIWHVKTGRYLYEFSCEPSDHGIGAVAISNDLKSVAICDSGLEMQIWEPLTGRCVYKFEHCDASDVRFSSDSKYLATISLIEDEVQIWEIATGVCLFSVCGGDPLAWFDPATGDILTEGFIFKNLSWENWCEFPRQGYSSASLLDETWICLDGQKLLLIPYELRPPIRGPSVLSNSFLMAFTSIADQVIIIKFPEYRDLKEQETTMLGASSTSNPG